MLEDDHREGGHRPFTDLMPYLPLRPRCRGEPPLPVGGGAWLIAAAWRVLHAAQRHDTLGTTGADSYVRHPQYASFVLIMFGFLLQWPTLLTLAMFPVLVWTYVRLARSEEREVEAGFGEAYRRYPQVVERVVEELLRHAQVSDPALGFLALLEKAGGGKGA